jgi:DNA repair protein RecN (Recombination protein N)
MVRTLAVTSSPVKPSPRVAARANQHLLISKEALDKGKRVATRVAPLVKDHRREEIARMLAGAEITAEARAAAERLLKAAG